jgi:signal recognition particle GTPase
MLASPSSSELAQLKKAVAIMTPNEKENAAALTDEQILRIAADAGVDAAVLAIFINGYALENSRRKPRR